MTESHQGRAAMLRTFVFLIVWLVVVGWGLSSWQALKWMPWLALAGVVGAGFLMFRCAGSGHNLPLDLVG